MSVTGFAGRRSLAAIAMLALLGACAADDVAAPGGTSTGAEITRSPLAAIADFLPGDFGGGGAAAPAVDDAAYAAEGVAGAMWLPSYSVPAPMRLVQDNGGDRTYSSPYGFDAAFDDGLLVGTRGLPDDLMGANVTQVAQAIRAGGGSAVRIHDRLDSLDRVVQERFDCEIVASGAEQIDLGGRMASLPRFTETCSSPTLVFENLYWLGANGEIAASRQFVTQTVAYLRFARF
ncbi:YjbF family lipoprotein [Wenxinia saemankumensis]|uniref:Group 4 capsule polysaccharide lipoprotein gfcB, YjbF n=1 Tax=Wenxinia saemankumensis TaxID=1447782 RepID=A0A1M6FX86_9RHOB|nr:YjbF family lipoprotein [Wenxinia saemankumensis]SHJ02335.1 Group 4 capsule polysaccharide lipoprotein gfcB, YjbF [Wenxinia saemankumensis]